MSSDKKQSVTSRIVFDYLMSHKLKIILALLMMVISAAATGLHAWLVRPALDEVLIKGNKEMLFLIPIAIISLSNKESVLSTIDLCPKVKGENDPGKTAIFFIIQRKINFYK